MLGVGERGWGARMERGCEGLLWPCLAGISGVSEAVVR